MPRPSTNRHASYLVPKSRLNVKPITVRIPAALLDQLAALKARADNVGFVLDIPCAVTEALERTAEDVAASLERLEKGGSIPETPSQASHSARHRSRKKDEDMEAETAKSPS